MSARRILLEDGTNRILLEDGTNFLLKDDSVAQASDDVLLRVGPFISNTDHSGLVAPLFTAAGGTGGAVGSPFYYNMMSQWFEAA